MNLNEYRNRNRRPITLPSGLKGWVRAPNLMQISKYPHALRAAQSAAAGQAPEEEAEFVKEGIHMALLYCFVPEGGVMVDKAPGRCGPNELSIHELDKDDAIAIVNAVNETANPPASAEAAGGAGSFPGPAGADGAPREAAPGGADLRDPAPPAPAGDGGGARV